MDLAVVTGGRGWVLAAAAWPSGVKILAGWMSIDHGLDHLIHLASLHVGEKAWGGWTATAGMLTGRVNATGWSQASADTWKGLVERGGRAVSLSGCDEIGHRAGAGSG
jgi:hypothetical protein